MFKYFKINYHNSLFFSKFILLLTTISISCIFPLHHITKNLDFFYPKFLNSSSSLIVGTSRALGGLKPELIGTKLEIEKPFLNFAFTMANSPYGPKYLAAIKKKVSTNSKKGLFILEVSPLAISIMNKSNINDDQKLYRENEGVINTIFVTQNPNVEYLIKHSERPIYTSFIKYMEKSKSNYCNGNCLIYSNGWKSFGNYDQKKFQTNIENGTKQYRQNFNKSKISPQRIKYLEETIKFLSSKGSVFLVRLPVSEVMQEMEDEYCPNFNTLMENIAKKNKIEYIDFSDQNKDFQTMDLHHLSSKSASDVSLELNKIIQTKLSYSHNNESN